VVIVTIGEEFVELEKYVDASDHITWICPIPICSTWVASLKLLDGLTGSDL